MENNYRLMDKSDFIPENYNKFPWAVYIAFDFNYHILAVGNYNLIDYKAVSRGCNTPYIENAVRILTPEQVKEHNNLLKKALKQNKN